MIAEKLLDEFRLSLPADPDALAVPDRVCGAHDLLHRVLSAGPSGKEIPVRDAQTVETGGKDVMGKADAGFSECHGKEVAVLHRHQRIRLRLPQKARRRILFHLFLERIVQQILFGRLTAKQCPDGIPVRIFPGGDHRIGEDDSVRPVGAGSISGIGILHIVIMNRETPADVRTRGKAADDQFSARDPVFLRIPSEEADRAGDVLQRLVPERYGHGDVRRVGQHEYIHPAPEEFHRGKLSLVRDHHAVPAAGDDQHRITRLFVRMQIGLNARKKTVGGFIVILLGCPDRRVTEFRLPLGKLGHLIVLLGIGGFPAVDPVLRHSCFEHGIVCILCFAFSAKEQRITGLPAESCEPAVLILEVPEGHGGDIRFAVFPGIQIDAEELPIAL